MLNAGRHYHASCAFNGDWLYVFCGISNMSRKYLNSIERVNFGQVISGMAVKWSVIQPLSGQGLVTNITARQGLGASQLNEHGILIVGGFSGKFLNEAVLIDVETHQLHPQPPMIQDLFPFAVPTVSEPTESAYYTVDWSTY